MTENCVNKNVAGGNCQYYNPIQNMVVCECGIKLNKTSLRLHKKSQIHHTNLYDLGKITQTEYYNILDNL